MKGFKHKLLAVIQHLVVVSGGRVLLLKYSGYQSKGVEGLWGLPGGHYVSGTPVADLLREVSEETGLAIAEKPDLIRTYVVLFPDGVERYGVFYKCVLSSNGIPPVILSDEHTEYMWAGSGDTRGLPFIGPYHRAVVEDVLARKI